VGAIPPGPLVVAFAPIDEPRTGTDVRRVPVRVQSWLAVSKFETTFADWDRCVAEGGCGGYTPGDNGHGRGSKPVVNVNYTDVEAYVRWLNNRAGYTPVDPRRYRLLTEQEWEYAARAGSTTRFFWGDDPNYTEGCAWANVADSSLRASAGRFSIPDGQLFRCADQSPFSSAVGRYRPNPWGLHDMIGNAAEIVLTRPGADYIMIRGGSWLSERGFHHSASKAYTRSRDAREYTVGFRVVREVTMPTE
jgi:formylglycine-generating enzyme required for sulfatase activity